MSVFDGLFPAPVRAQDASDLERTLWIRSLLGDQVDVGPSDALAQRIREKFFEAGQWLYRQGGASDRIYFIVRGAITLSHAGVKNREFGPRDVIGVFDAMQNRPHAFDAIVREDATVLELEFEDWLEFLEDHFEMTRNLMARLVESLPPTSPPRPDLSKPTARRFRVVPAPAGGNNRAPLGPTQSLSFVERLAVLRACPPFAEAGIQALARLAHFSELITLEQGENRILEAPAVYVVESGRVRSTTSDTHGNTWHEEVGAGGSVAGLGLLVAGRFDSEVVALQDSALFRLPTERLFDVMEDHFSLALSMLAHTSAEAEAATLQHQINSAASSRSGVDPLFESAEGLEMPDGIRRG